MVVYMSEHIEHARKLLSAIETGAVGEDLRGYYHPDAVQVEHPSLVSPNGGTRGLDAMLAASHRGKALLTEQRYDVTSAMASEDVVTLQLTWTASLAIPMANLQPGDQLRAHVAMFLKYLDGRVVLQETYDCYEPL